MLSKVRARFLLILLTVIFFYSSYALAGRLKGECFLYSYKTVLDILSSESSLTPAKAKEKAFNMAGDSCRMEVNDKCLKYSYERILEVYQHPIIDDHLKVWGEAVNVCRKKVDDKCLQYSEKFWKQTNKERDSYRAFQNAATSCHDEIYGDCLQYVFERELNRGRSEMAAFNSGVTVCRGGTYKSCLQTLYEKISPDARPHVLNPWDDVVSVCIRK